MHKNDNDPKKNMWPTNEKKSESEPTSQTKKSGALYLSRMTICNDTIRYAAT